MKIEFKHLTSLPPANATLPINPLAGVPYFLPFAKHYGRQSLIRSSPHFCKYYVCVCMFVITTHFVTCEMFM